MEEVLSGVVRLTGIGVLKAVTLGRYRSDEGSVVAEGALGLAVVAAILWIAYRVFMT